MKLPVRKIIKIFSSKLNVLQLESRTFCVVISSQEIDRALSVPDFLVSCSSSTIKTPLRCSSSLGNMDQAKKTFNYSTKRYSLSLTSVAAQLSDNACDSQKKERWEQRQRLRQFRTGLGQFSIPSWGEEDHSEGGHEHAGQHRQESGQGGGSLLLSQRFSRDAQVFQYLMFTLKLIGKWEKCFFFSSFILHLNSLNCEFNCKSSIYSNCQDNHQRNLWNVSSRIGSIRIHTLWHN